MADGSDMSLLFVSTTPPLTMDSAIKKTEICPDQTSDLCNVSDDEPLAGIIARIVNFVTNL
jgi:hypothetical protein